MRRFIPDIVRVTLPINKLLRKDEDFKWSQEAKEAFNEINEWIAKAPVLVGPNFDKDILIYSYSSEEAYTAMLMQKDDEHNEKPITFLSESLKDYQSHYTPVEKQAFALIKAIEDFKPYIIHTHTIAYVPLALVKAMLGQAEPSGKWARWLTKIREFDVDIKLVKIMQGKGLCRMIVES